MNKVILPVAVLAIGAAGYLFWADQSNEVPAVDATAPQVPAPTAEDAVEDAADATRDAAQDTARTVEETVQDATETARDAADAASDTARTLAEEAAQAVDTAVESATAAAGAAADATREAVDTATQAAREALNTATGAAPAEPAVDLATLATTTGLTEAEVTAALTPEGFDYDRAARIIAASNISDTQKTLLTTGLDRARNTPLVRDPLLAQARSALGL